ncbi:MAG: hypothetical protein ACRD3S_06220 [Terracidiphilus sp.]
MESDFKASQSCEPRYDQATRTWTLSRFADVSAALKESALVLASSSGEAINQGADSQGADSEERSPNASGAAADMLRMLDGCREAMNDAARRVVCAASARGQADLVFDIAHEWSATIIAKLCMGPDGEPPEIKHIARALLCEGIDRSGRTGM